MSFEPRNLNTQLTMRWRNPKSRLIMVIKSERKSPASFPRHSMMRLYEKNVTEKCLRKRDYLTARLARQM